MQHELEQLQPQLMKMAEENVNMMQFIDSQSQEMEYNSEVVRAEEVVAKRQAAAAQALKDECEAELAEAVPALEAAIAALNTLKVYSVHDVLKFGRLVERPNSIQEWSLGRKSPFDFCIDSEARCEGDHPLCSFWTGEG